MSYPPTIESIESKRLSFPLSFLTVSSYISNRLALVGDAAHSIHPQGFIIILLRLNEYSKLQMYNLFNLLY